MGHGTLSGEELAELLLQAGVQNVVDVRRFPGSRRHPQFAQAELERWLPMRGVEYRWDSDLGGFRRTTRDSPNVALENSSFRGYADYMTSTTFQHALTGLLEGAARRITCVMCAETLWWRCHRRLIADAAVLLHQFEVWHLDHGGRLVPHRLTDPVRLDGRTLVYDGAPGP